MLLPARTEAAAVGPSDRATRPLGLEAETWLLVGITVLAAAVRFVNITSQSFWLDESQAVHEVHLSFGAMLHAWSSYVRRIRSCWIRRKIVPGNDLQKNNMPKNETPGSVNIPTRL